MYDDARYWHLIFKAVFILFFFGRLFMVMSSGWSNFASINDTGWKTRPG
ncbi:MAG TPA: hypothetical protein VEO56_03555 [Bacteroidota bacterium]|nr:hypothetical protein [Bacteroidota bacterium]